MQLVDAGELPFKDGVKYVIRGPNIDWGLLKIEPGQTFQPHYHEEVGETFYTVEGKGEIILAGANVDLEPGIAIRLEPKESHGLKNTGDAPLLLLFIKDTYKPKDKVMVE